MSGGKVGLYNVNSSSEVTMINEDGVIAEMIIEVDDDNQQEAHQPFNFDLDDDDDDCVEVYSSGFASSGNSYIEHNSRQNWMHDKDSLFHVNSTGATEEMIPGLQDLNLLGKSGVASFPSNAAKEKVLQDLNLLGKSGVTSFPGNAVKEQGLQDLNLLGKSGVTSFPGNAVKEKGLQDLNLLGKSGMTSFPGNAVKEKGLQDLNLLGKSGVTSFPTNAVKEKDVERSNVAAVKNVTDSEKKHDCIITNNSLASKPRRMHSRKSPPPKSGVVTRGKAAASELSVDNPKKAVSAKVAKEGSVGAVMEITSDKDTTTIVSKDIAREVTGYKGGDSNPILTGISKETSNKVLTDQISEDVTEEKSDAHKETPETTLDLGSKVESTTTAQSKETVVPAIVPAPDCIGSTTLVPWSKGESTTTECKETVVPESSPVPDSIGNTILVQGNKEENSTIESTETSVLLNISSSHKRDHSGEVKMSNSPASKKNEANSLNHDEDKAACEEPNMAGCGDKLEDIPFIQQVIQNTTKRLGLQMLYKLTYGFRIPKNMEMIKDRVLQFNGFCFEENSVDFERKLRLLKTFPDLARKQICCMLGIALINKTDTSNEILKFLVKPKNNQITQFMRARYQPLVRLERLPKEILKCETVEGNLAQMITPAKEENPVRKLRKRKAAVENSEVRLTRSAKRLMKQNEEEKGDEAKTERNISPSSDASEKKSPKLKKHQNKSPKVPTKSQNDEGNVKSENDGNNFESRSDGNNVKPQNDGNDIKSKNVKKAEVKNKYESDTATQSSDSETDDADESVNYILQDSSDDEPGCSKGTLGRKLGDFWQIRQSIEKADKDSLQTLHTILYDNYSNYDKPENWKKNILRFSGFNFKSVSNKWRRKEFILSLMPLSKLKHIADMLHLQYFGSKSQKPLVLNIMKFLSEPRDGMLKRNDLPQKKRGRRKMFGAARKQNKQAALDEENSALEVQALLQDIRKKWRSIQHEDSSADSELLGQNSFRKSKKKKLGNIPNVQFMIITSNYEDIDNLHQLLFLQSGPRAKIRRNVQNFEGFTFGPGSFSYKIRIKLLNKMGYEVAKRIAFFLGLASLGTTIPQQDLNELIMHFLMCPSDIKYKSIKAYPKNFFNNNPTERPVVDITSITDAMESTMEVEKKLAKQREHKRKRREIKKECEIPEVESDILENPSKKTIKIEKDSPQKNLSEPDVMGSDTTGSAEHKVNNDDIVQKVKKSMQDQNGSEMPFLISKAGQKRRSARKKLHILGLGKKKRTTFRKDNQSDKNIVKSEAEDSCKKQFLFRFDPSNEFDSKKILEYLNKESQKSVVEETETTKSEVAEPIQTDMSNIPSKVTAKSEHPAKVISILLPPPSQSPPKNVSVSSDITHKTNSIVSSTVCTVSYQSTSTSSSTVSSHPEGKLPMPSLRKKQMISLTPQLFQNLQAKAPSTNVTQIKVPPNLLESIKGSQIEGVIRLPQNFVIGQNSGQISSPSTAPNDVLSLPEVQKCLQQINNDNGRKKQVQMIKIPANNSVAFQPGSLNMSGGKVYVIPVKSGSQQFSSVVPPMQLNNHHIVVPSSMDSSTPVNIPQLIQVAKNYSRTSGATSVSINNVTIAKVRPDFVGPISLPTVSASQSLFPVSVTPNSNLVELPVLKVQETSGKEPNSAQAPMLLHFQLARNIKDLRTINQNFGESELVSVLEIDKAHAEKSKENECAKQQKDYPSSDSELDEEPLSHLVGHPSDDMLVQDIREIVIGADLSSITMRKVLQKVFDKYPRFDLTYRKFFLKDAVKKVICSAPPSKIT